MSIDILIGASGFLAGGLVAAFVAGKRYSQDNYSYSEYLYKLESRIGVLEYKTELQSKQIDNVANISRAALNQTK